MTQYYGPLSPQEVQRRLEAAVGFTYDEKAFDPHQPRGEHTGQWVKTPGSGAGIGVLDTSKFSSSFNAARTENRRVRMFTTEHDPSYYDTAIGTKDGKAGGALHGDEIINLYNLGGGKGAGREILRELKAAGGRRLDATGEVLRKFYESEGFKVTDTAKFDPDLAPDGWDPAQDGQPNIYFMALDSKT